MASRRSRIQDLSSRSKRLADLYGVKDQPRAKTKKKKKKRWAGNDMLRAEYAAYRKKMTQSPGTVAHVLSFSDWVKKRKKKGDDN